MKSASLIGRATRSCLALAASVALLGPGLAQAVPEDLLRHPRVRDPAALLREMARGADQLAVIVNLRQTVDIAGFSAWQDPGLTRMHRARVASLLDQILADLDYAAFSLRHRMENQPCFSGRMTLQELRRVLEHPLIESVEVDEPVEATTDQGITLMNANGVRSAYDGSNISIAIVDTGIDYNHLALGGGGFPNAKVIGGYDFGDDDADPLDLNGHGTSVAGIAAGDVLVSGDYVGGVAHGARLYALKIVAGGSRTAASSDIIASWDWCVTHKVDDPENPILVINTSFGASTFNTAPCGGGAYGTAASNATSAGMTLFISSGNDGFCGALGSPACVPGVISVGAVYDANIGSQAWCISPLSCIGGASTGCTTGWACQEAVTTADQVTCYSNSADFLTLLAPSNNATTVLLGGGYTPAFGGTSAASPYAAGAAALLIDAAFDAGILLTPDAIETLLVDTGRRITDQKSGIRTPRLDLGNAHDGLTAIWVDFGYVGVETGSWLRPFNTLSEGVAAVPPGGSLWIRKGSTAETPTIDKAMNIHAAGGGVTIGS